MRTMSQLLTITALLFIGRIAAQTSSACDPLTNGTCAPDPALGTTFFETYNQSMTGLDTRFWNITAGESLISYGESGMQLQVAQHGDSVTLQTQFYIFWGRVELIMQAAAGTGIISTVNLLSDALDEIDWEIMGGNTSYVENNYYGQGNTSQYNAKYPALNGAQSGFHNYTIDWNQEQIQWLIDGNVVRTQPFEAPGLYPQTPCFVKVGIWAGGDYTEPKGTIQWAGGQTDYSKGPFNMIVQSITIVDGTTNSSQYTYGDQSGSWQSIKVAEGQSQAFQDLNKPSEAQSIQQHWNGLSNGAKIGIACGVLGTLAIGFLGFIIYCIKQRRAGRREKLIADKEWATHENELAEYKRQMAKGQFAVSHLTTSEVHYGKF